VLIIGRSRIKQWIPKLADDDRRCFDGPRRWRNDRDRAMLATTVFPVWQSAYTEYGGYNDGVLKCSKRMRHREDGAAWSRCARMICSLPPNIHN
jgi:hypothetical protein